MNVTRIKLTIDVTTFRVYRPLKELPAQTPDSGRKTLKVQDNRSFLSKRHLYKYPY